MSNIQDYFKPVKIKFETPRPLPVAKENVYLRSLKRKFSDLNDLQTTSIDQSSTENLHVVENVLADGDCSVSEQMHPNENDFQQQLLEKVIFHNNHWNFLLITINLNKSNF